MSSARIRETVEASVAAKRAVLADEALLGGVERAAAMVIGALRAGNRVLLFGNGGSAADAQHVACELVGRFLRDRRALPAEALTVNPSVITAVGNDFGFADVFARQVEAAGRPGDVAIGITTSGRSPNVVRGLAAARAGGLATIALCGRAAGPAGETADVALCVPDDSTPRVQECHLLIGHILCDLVEEALASA